MSSILPLMLVLLLLLLTSSLSGATVPQSILARARAPLATAAGVMTAATAAATAAGTVPLAAIQPPPSLPVLSVADLDKQEYAKSPFNLPPGEAKYPTFLEGVWRADCRFVDAVFTPQIPLKQLSSDVNVAGFRKYSVGFFPDLGSDYTTNFQWKLRNGYAVEDRVFNLVNTLRTVNGATVDDVEYDPVQNPNRCSLRYTDSRSTGKLELFTNYREQQPSLAPAAFPARLFATYRPSSQPVTAANVKSACRTFESFRQSSVRAVTGQRASQIILDYALEWCYFELDGGDVLATARILSYLQPQDPLYFVRPEKPVGCFEYAVAMRRV